MDIHQRKTASSFWPVRFCAILFLYLPVQAHASTGQWFSKACNNNIAYTITESATPKKDNNGNFHTVIYMENLAIQKIGKNSNAIDVAWLLNQGYRVIELNYDNNENAISPTINEDIIAINAAINKGLFCGLSNCSKYRSYILFEGYRIAQDVPYFVDDPTVYNYPASYEIGDSLRMDIIYPANADQTVPVILSFAYSNSWATDANRNQRLNLGNTLAGFNDSFLEGAPAKGIAWAIADHPKYCSWGNGKPVGGANDTYKSYQTNPDAAQKVKSAIRTLRVLGDSLGLSGKIGIYGFSRGSDAGSMAVGDRFVETFEHAGFHQEINSKVQTAALGSGVFDFTRIYHASGDGDSNLETRCPWAWGPLNENFELWQTMGSAYLAQTSATAPVLFFYNTTDAVYYQDQIANFKYILDSIGAPTFTLKDYGNGHSVPQDKESLSNLYNFFTQYLITAPVSIDKIRQFDSKQPFQISILPSQTNNEISMILSLPNAGIVNFQLFNLSGTMIHNSQKYFETAGKHSETLLLNRHLNNSGIYLLNIQGSGFKGSAKVPVF